MKKRIRLIITLFAVLIIVVPVVLVLYMLHPGDKTEWHKTAAWSFGRKVATIPCKDGSQMPASEVQYIGPYERRILYTTSKDIFFREVYMSRRPNGFRPHYTSIGCTKDPQ